MKKAVAAMAGMFLLIVWPFGGLVGMGFQAILGGGVEQSFLWPLYAGILVLAGILAGATSLILHEIRELKKEIRKSKEEEKEGKHTMPLSGAEEMERRETT